MDVAMLSKGDRLNVVIEGMPSLAEREKFREILEQFSSSEIAHAMIDVSNVHAFGSEGLGLFMVMRSSADANRIGLSIRGAQARTLKLLKLGGFEKLLVADNDC